MPFSGSHLPAVLYAKAHVMGKHESASHATKNSTIQQHNMMCAYDSMANPEGLLDMPLFMLGVTIVALQE